MDAHTESALARARREFGPTLTSSVKAWLWAVSCTIVSAALVTKWGSAFPGGVVSAGVVGGGVTVAVTLGGLFGALWVTAPVRQRNEARAVISAEPSYSKAKVAISLALSQSAKLRGTWPGSGYTGVELDTFSKSVDEWISTTHKALLLAQVEYAGSFVADTGDYGSGWIAGNLSENPSLLWEMQDRMAQRPLKKLDRHIERLDKILHRLS